MSTELQKQINSQLRSNELNFLSQKALRVNRNKEKISFLFDTKAEFYGRKGVIAENRIPIYEDIGRLKYLGEQGLLELESLNPKISYENFNEFFENTEITSIQMLTKQEADNLLEKLKRFIDFLVPYFLLDSAKICIEYLIQAYDINVLLGEYLFYSFLPYHDMAEFCQLIRTLDIPEDCEVKGLTDSIKNTKTVITSRSNLSSILLRNPTMFRNIVAFWEKRLEIFHLTKNLALTNLITWLIIEIIDDLSRSKDLKNLPFFLENIIEIIIFGTCLKGSQYEELRSTGYCILYKLATPLLNLSNEIQIRIINELFRTISKSYPNSSNYFSETILLMNHILTQLGTLSHFEYLDQEISQFILENQIIFINTFKQLTDWDSDFLQILTLITKSIINFGTIQKKEFSKLSLSFIENILSNLGDTSSYLLINEKQSKMIKVIILSLIDLYSQDQAQNPFFGEIIQILHSNYPSELLSALKFSLNISSNSNSQLFQLKEKAQMFVDIVIKEEVKVSDLQSKEEENSRMFLSLLNSQDPSILNSCLDIIMNLINKSSNNPKEMTHFERKVFDLSLRHFLTFFDSNNNNPNHFQQEFILKILSQPQIIQISQFLDLENMPSQDQDHLQHNHTQYRWRTYLIFKSFLFYFQSKIISEYPTLEEFFSKEVSTGLNFNDQNFNIGIENVIMESIFTHIFGPKFEKKLLDLFTNFSLLFTENNFNHSNLITLENSDTIISLLILISQENLSISQDLKEISSKLLSILFQNHQVHDYFKNILNKSNLNYLELSIILLSLNQLHSDLKSSNCLLPNHSFSKFGITFNNNQQIINLLELLYYKLYYSIHSSINSNNDKKKIIHHLIGTYTLTILRSILYLVSTRRDKIFFDYKLLNISLIDTLDIGILSNNHLGLPIFQIINSCFDSNLEKRNQNISDLALNLTGNLFNILCKNNFIRFHQDQYYSPFYGKNIYLEALISHSYSFIEIIITKLPISKDSKNTLPVSNLLEILYCILAYAIIPAFLEQNSMSIKMASFRLCKAIKDKLQEINIEQVFGNTNLKFSSILNKYTGTVNHYLRSTYLNQVAPKLNQILEIFDLILNYQSQIILENQNPNLFEMIFNNNQISNHIPGTILIINMVMIFELIFNNTQIEDILSNYIIKQNFNYGIISSNYHEILINISQTLIDKENQSEAIIIIGLSFLKQGIDNLITCKEDHQNKELKNKLIMEYLSKIQRFDKEFQYFHFVKENYQIKQIFIQLLLTVLNDKITSQIKNDQEFVSFIIGIISKIINYSPENIKQVSLSQYIQGKSLERLDQLIIGLLQYCLKESNTELDSNSIIGINEQIILQWIYSDLNLISFDILNNIQEESSSYQFNKDLVCQALKYLEMNLKRYNNLREELDLEILNKIEIYLIRILEFGVKSRNTQFKNLEEILNYFDNSKYILNPMVISSITSLFSNIQIRSNIKDTVNTDLSKSYFKVYKILFSIYINFIKNIQNGGIEKKIYSIKSTFYSLSLFIDHNLQKCKYFDQYNKERMKSILFKILTSEVIKEIVEFNKFNKIHELLNFMEKLYNEVIYKQRIERFRNIQGIFMIIRFYLSKNKSSEFEDLDELFHHLLKNKEFDTRISVYKDLLTNIQDEMQILMRFEDLEQNNDHIFETKKVIMENLILMTKTIIYFLNKTLLNTEIKSNEIQDLIELFDKLILIKTLMSKKILKKFGTVLKNTETDLEINEKLKIRIDHFEKENLLKLDAIEKKQQQEEEEENDQDNSLVLKSIRKEIDQLIQSIIENDNIKKYLIKSWDISKNTDFQIIKNLRKRFDSLLLSNKMDYLGIILKESNDKRIKVTIDEEEEDSLKKPIIFNTMEYLLENVVIGQNSIKDHEMLIDDQETLGDCLSESENEKEDLRFKLKLWIKNWYIIDLILKVIKINKQEKLTRLIFSKILNFYNNYQSIQDGYGLIYKIPLIQNFLLERISRLEKNEFLSIINEIQIILEDTIRTIKIFSTISTISTTTTNNNNSSILKSEIFQDKKVKSILISMITSNYKGFDKNPDGESDGIKALLLPYLALLNALLNSSIGSVMMNSEIRNEILVNILLNDKMVLYYDFSQLTNLLKSERLRKLSFNSRNERSKKVEESNDYIEDLSLKSQNKNSDNSNQKLKFYLEELNKKMKSSSELLGDTLENYIVRILLIYCNLTSSPKSHSYNEDFISVYSQIFKEISSELFSRLNLEENSKIQEKLIEKGVDIYYSKLTSLVLIMSFSLNFMDAGKLISEKSFIDKFSQFYLLIINLLIINFTKLYSIKEKDLKMIDNDNLEDLKIRNGREKLSGRKRTEEEKDDNDNNNNSRCGNKVCMNSFISSIFGEDILLSHGCVNPDWFDLDIKDLKKLSNLRLNNVNSRIISIWRLESSISTLISVFVLKLNAKRLSELILLIKRLIHRNGESFLSRVSSMTKKSDDSKAASNSDKQAIRDVYNEMNSSSNSDLVKDIYCCRIWILILLGVFESTGEYGIICLIDDLALDLKSISDLTQMNALTCVQNITISQYRNSQSPSKRSSNHQQIANLNHLNNDFGWYWYHLGIYNLILIKMIYLNLSGEKEEIKDIPNSIEDYLVNPIITNLDMFALFEPNSTRGLFGCGKQWDIILSEIWINSIKCFRNNDLILANIIRLLVNKIRNGNDQVRIFSAEILLKLWKNEICSISILSHLSDILPTIKELLNDHSEEMINITKSIIKKIEERTGEDISKQFC